MQTPYLNAHQSRSKDPTIYENLLGDALERAYAGGVTTVDGIVAHLEASGVPTPNGQAWTAALFESEMRRLGA